MRRSDDSNASHFDVFLSYARLDDETGRVSDLAASLRTQGLRVFVDDQEIQEFESIPDSVRQAIGDSRLFLAFYSKTYPTRRACQWELTTAVLAEQRQRHEIPQVLVVNPEPSWDHIHPVQLRERLIPSVPHEPDSLMALAARVAELAETVHDTLGDVDEVLPDVFGYRLINSPAFVGRLPQLWALHSALQSRSAAELMGTSDGTGVALLVGIGGVGKSLLAEEYALRFAAAYPGGIFWLRASSARDGSHRVGDRDAQMREIARALGASVDDLDPQDVAVELREQIARRPAALWVVDDLPPGLSSAEVRDWLAPHPYARTLITTRSTDYRAIAETVELRGLSEDEGYVVLARRRLPEDDAEEQAARGLVADLAGHALALAVTAAALEAYRGMRSFADYRRALRVLTHDELELAAELAEELPNGHHRSVAATLARSIDLLQVEGLDLLLLASWLAPVPIPLDAVVGSFAVRLGMDAEPALERAILLAARALSQVKGLCLCESTPNGPLVHHLVSRTMQHRAVLDGSRRAAFRPIATGMIAIELREHVQRPPSATASMLLEHGHRLLVDQPGDDAATLDLMHGMAHCELERGHYAAAARLHERLLTAFTQLRGAEHPNTLGSMINLAHALAKQGDSAAAEAHQEQAARLSARVLGREHPTTLAALTGLALIRQDRGELAAARELLERLVDIHRQQLGEEHPTTAVAICNLVTTLRHQGELDAACRMQQQALAVLRRTLGDDDPATQVAEHNLGDLLGAQGNYAAARALQERLLETRRRTLGPSHPRTLACMNNLASTLRQLDELDAARRLHQEVLETATSELGATHPYTLSTMGNLATTLRLQGSVAEARAIYERVLDARRSTVGDDHPDTLTALSNLGEALHAEGALAEAEEIETQALALRRRVLGDHHPDTLMSMSNLSATFLRRGDLAAARGLQVEALGGRQRTLGAAHPDTLASMTNLGAILNSQGALDEARDVQARALELTIGVLGAEHSRTLVLMHNLARTLRDQGDVEASEALYRRAQELATSSRTAQRDSGSA